MKLYCLSGHGSRPCFVLRFKHTTVMLDCGLDISTLLHFVPIPPVQGGRLSELSGWSSRDLPGAPRLDEELKEIGGRVFVDGQPEFALPELGLLDLSEVDVLLLSNYHCMLALPYLTQYTNFKGIVYATEPTLHIGRLYMEELVQYISHSPRQQQAAKWKQHISFLPPPLRDLVTPHLWRPCFNLQDIQASLAKVQTVGFNQITDVFGSLEVVPVSSGYAIGSCNWILRSEYHKIAYLSGSSTLTTHPKPMEHNMLKNSDIIILCSMTQTPTANPDAMIGEFCVNAATTLKNGGNVLVPCYPSGMTYDLFECLSGHLESCGLGAVPLYFISPVAASSLAYSNIYAEWLSSDKQSKVYLPEPPFPHAEVGPYTADKPLVKNNRLKHYPNIHEGFNQDMRTPCVVFTGHPSLRFGNVVHFLELWGKSSTNTVIITEPDFPYLEALAPYQPLSMKVSYCPIDTSLSFSQANKLIKELRPRHLVAPEQYTVPPIHLPHRTELVLDTDPKPMAFKKAEVLTLPIKRTWDKVDLHPQLAATLVPKEVRPGIAVSMVSGNLVNKDNQFSLQPPDLDSASPSSPEPCGQSKPLSLSCSTKPPVHVWGTVDVQEFVTALHQQGIQDARVEESPGTGHIVEIPSEDTLIQIDGNSTHIICSNEALRIKLRDNLLKFLGKL